eukprot:scaffold4931_cov17-Tisochrysis_lutea.AAC.1
MSVCDIAVALPPCAGARTGVRGPCSGFKIRHMNWLYKEQEKPFANSASHHLNQALCLFRLVSSRPCQLLLSSTPCWP